MPHPTLSAFSPVAVLWIALAAVVLGGCSAPVATQSADLSEVRDRTDMVGELRYGQTVDDVAGPARYRGLTFEAKAGDVISAYVASNEIDPTLGLFGPLEREGAMDSPRALVEDVRADRPAAHLIDHPIDESGTYALVVADASGTGGAYRARLACTGGTCRPRWLEDARTDCALSPLGDAVQRAALGADQSRNTVPADAAVQLRNRAGDALLTGTSIFPAMADRIALAQHEVDIAFFVYNYSDAYDEVGDALARLESRQIAKGASEPVIVRIVVDSMKAFVNRPEDMAMRVFDGISHLHLDPQLVHVSIATYEHLALGNLHTKTVVIDGTTGMLGGANIQSQHDYADPWMDSFYTVQGEAAQALLADFDDAYDHATQWVCSLDERGQPTCQPWPDAPSAWHTAAVLDPDVGALGLEGACIPTIVLSRTAWGGLNNDVNNPQDQGFLAAMDGAQSSIHIQTPNLNDDAVRDALIRALERGVEVRIVLSMGFNDGPMNLLGGTNEEVAADLFRRAQGEAPTHADLLHIRWYSRDGAQPVDGNVSGASHLKYTSVDGQLAIVGSSNMDTISWNHSRETNLAVDHPGVAASWDAQVFEPNYERAIPAR